LSDRIGRRNTFYCFFLLGIPLYAAMPALGESGHIALFVAGFCVLMSMFGGAFATVPAYLSDMFGTEMVGAIQGRVLTAWSTAGVIGPLLISAIRNQQLESATPMARAYDPAFYLLAALLLVGLVCNALVRPVAERHFMDSTELEKHRREIRHYLPRTPGKAGTLAMPSTLAAQALAVWLAVCLPIAWGIWMTVQRAAVLL
jgi:MFS family permease